MNEETLTALTVTARAALALGSDKARTELAALVAKSANILEVKNADGRAECHAAAMALVKARTTIEKIGKTAREDATAFSKAVIQEEKALVSITSAEEARLLALRNAWDEARAAEKAEAERIERARITAIHERIAAIRAYADAALQAKTSAAAGELIERLMAESIEGFDEFDAEAITARGLALARMSEIRDTKAGEEAERARISAEQEAERQRLAAERAELARLQAEARAAQEKADAERRAQAEADAAELARQRKALEEENARINAEMEAKRAAFMAEVEAVRKAQEEVRAALVEAVADEPELLPTAANEPERAPLVLVPDSEPLPPSAEDIIATAIGAVADRFDLSWSDAAARLSAIDWTVIDANELEAA